MSCPLCDDTGWKSAEAEDVAPGAASSARRVVRCDCWRDNVGRQRLRDANIPRRYEHCTLGNFTAYNESLLKAVAQARRIADAFPVVSKGLLLEGQPGVGKTHLAVAVLKQAIQTTGASGLFYDIRESAAAHSQHLRSGDSYHGARSPASGHARRSAGA